MKILGGEGANRLHRVLRSERGLTYGAEANSQAMKQAGDFVAETNTRTETTGEALRLTVEEFAKLQRQRVFERELADAGLSRRQFSADDRNAERHRDHRDERALLRAAARGDQHVPRACRPLRRTTSSVSPAAHQARPAVDRAGRERQGFVSQLRGVGFTEFEIIPIDQLDLMSATFTKEPRRASVVPGGPLRP